MIIVTGSEKLMTVRITFSMTIPKEFIKTSQRDGSYVNHPIHPSLVKYIYDEVSPKLDQIITPESLLILE